jgi:hypothetical protein
MELTRKTMVPSIRTVRVEHRRRQLYDSKIQNVDSSNPKARETYNFGGKMYQYDDYYK